MKIFNFLIKELAVMLFYVSRVYNNGFLLLFMEYTELILATCMLEERKIFFQRFPPGMSNS